ncbi:MAG: universal stress protein [Nitrospirae bacterium]|nr:universal stress protein [Nitrospirota bacterium]
MIEIKSILFPTDFSECSSQALLYAVDIAKRYGSRVYILHVVYDISKAVDQYVSPLAVEEMYKDITLRAKEEIEKFSYDGLTSLTDIERIVITGIPHEEIIHFVNKHNIDLIVMGTHGRKGIDRILFGSTAANVVRFAPCPVLTVRVPKHRE